MSIYLKFEMSHCSLIDFAVFRRSSFVEVRSACIVGSVVLSSVIPCLRVIRVFIVTCQLSA